MDDSADMESLDDVAKPQSYIFGCELNAAKKVYKFNPEDDDDHAEMHLMLSSVCVAPEAEDRFHVLEVTTLGKGGKPVTIPIATLKPSVLPSLSLSGFDLAAPVVLTLKCGSGPVYISGQHVAYPCNDFHDDDDDDDDDDEEEPPKLVPAPNKRPAPFKVPQIAKKKTKLDEDDEDDEDDDDDDDDSYDDDDDDDDDEDEEEVPKQKVLVKVSGGSPRSLPCIPGIGGPWRERSPTPGSKTPKTPKSPKSPKGPISLEEVKTKLKEQIEKNMGMPKTEEKFGNFLKSSFKVEDTKVMKELWSWSLTQTKS
ncbi:unnamed protein product [Lampetra planeri]